MASESYNLIKDLKFCVIDLETTGGNHQTDRIIEIGLVQVENLEIVGDKSFLIQPERSIPSFIQSLTTITPKDVKDSPIISDVIDEIIEYIGDRIIVAHNTSFDVPFLSSVLERLGKAPIENPTLCTNLMTKHMIPGLMNSNLNYMSKIFKIPHDKAHRALDDAKATAELLLIYLNVFIEKGVQKVNHLYYPRNKYELDRHHFKSTEQREEALKVLEELKVPCSITLKGENGVILFTYPYSGSVKDKEFVAEAIKNEEWKNLTYKLTGPFIHALILFGHSYYKLSTHYRSKIMSQLWTNHLPSLKRSELDFAQIGHDYSNLGDFLISHHLVPEQLMIFPLKNLSPRSELVFRYPSHRKKLQQFINSRRSKIKQGKVKQPLIAAPLKEFMETYILEKTNVERDLFVYKSSMLKNNPDSLTYTIDDFLKKNPNPYNYPKFHI